MRRIFALAAAFAIAAWSSQVLADAAAGLAAYKAGDYPVALRELTPAAQAGDPEANYVLGVIYEQGLGVPASDLEAVKLYEAAAERGHAGAQYMLGVHQQIGLGTAVNLIESYKWLLLAQRGGVAAAKEFLGSFAGRMSPDDIARAMSLADALCAGGSAACRATQAAVAPQAPPPPSPAAVPEAPMKAAPPQAAVASEPFGGTFVVTRQSQLLDQPSPRGKRIALLHQWERVAASARDSNSWIRVTAQGKDGWIAAANIRDEKAAEDAEWSRINHTDVASLSAFVAHFPQGAHSAEAMAKLSARREQLARADQPEQNKQPTVVARTVRKKPGDEAAATSSLNRAETQTSPFPDGVAAGSAPLPEAPALPAIVGVPLADPSEQVKKPVADPKKMPARLYPQSSSPAAGPEVAMLEQNPISTIPDQTLMSGKPIDLYNRALSLINEGDFAAAETALKQILASYGSDPVAQNAEYHLADIYFRQGEFPKAAAAFQKFRSTYPRSANDPLALLNYATSLGRLGDKSGACKAFKDLGVQYPGLSGDAKEKKITEMRQAGCAQSLQ